MESKKINQLATELAPVLSDLTIIGDPTTGISKKITLSQMASLFTGTVEEYPNLASFPLVGTADTIYIALDTNIIYRWNTGTSAYVELSPNIVTSLVFSDANGFDGTISLVGSTATLTITTALTTGSVPFIGASGALSQDNANLFFDDTNNRLGINTNSPTTALDVFGSGIIGRINGTSTNNAFLGFASAGTNKWSIGNVQSDHRFRIYSEANTSELVSVLQTGEFGIGIANPTTKLHIDGGASALIANLDADISIAKSISFRSDNSARINLEVSGTESGSNAGADFFIRRYSDAGSLIDTPFKITRSTGIVEILKNDRANGALLRITNSFNGSGWIAGDIIGSLEFYSSDAGNAATRGAIKSISESGSASSSSTGLSFETYTSATLSQKMYLSGDGKLGIGSITPSSKIEIKQTITSPSPFFDARSDDGGGTNSSIFKINAPTNYSNFEANLGASRSILDVGTFGDGTGKGYSAVFRGSVGFGTATPSSPIHAYSTTVGLLALLESNQSNTQLRFVNSSTSGRTYSIGSGGSISGGGNGFYIFDETAGEKRVLITPEGYMRLDRKGIQFNGDTADANSLDDYEEGTFTPSVNLLGTVTYGVRIGYYTKIGNVVNYFIQMVLSSTDTTQDGSAYQITGLPFTSKGTDAALNPITPIMTEQFYKSSSFIGLYLQVSYNSTYGVILQNSFNNELANKTYYASAKRNFYVGANHYINITGYYYTS
jgi:hypothetical protein